MADFLTRFALAGAVALFAAWAVLANARRVRAALDALAAVPRWRLAAFLFFAAIATLSAQKRTLRGGGQQGTMSYSMPTNGIRYANWSLRGAYEDVFRLDLGGFSFPLGTNLCTSLWVYSWGMAGARLGDRTNRIVAVGAPMSAVPGLSQFWSADTDDGGKLLTWENFFLSRDTNTPVSAQLELFPSGDYVARSNDVETAHRRVNPDDWDDDGIPNGEDLQPTIYDGDFFGPQQELPEGANTNAYCWVDLVVTHADSLVTFAGDGYSALPDPTFIAKGGATNRVALLIGKRYQVTSRMPISCVGQSDCDIDIDQPSATELFICWPVTIDAVAMRSGASFSMSVTPAGLGGGFTWTNSCCSLSSSGWTFTYSCNDACHCTGCAAMGYYGYESYRLPAFGGSCGCSSDDEYDERPCEEDDDGPHVAGASATFSKSAVIFEDGYWNTPTNWVGRQSTQTELHCVAHGGPNGGHVRFEIAGESKLERVMGHVLPVEQDVSPGKKLEFTITYKGLQPSASTDDIIVTTTFTENAEGAEPVSLRARLTSVKVELTPIDLPPENQSPHRHILGIAEKVNYRFFPNVSGLALHDGTEGDMLFQIDDVGRCFYAPWTGGVYSVSIVMADANHDTLIKVVEPSVECRNVRRNGEIPSVSGEAGWIGMKFDLYLQPRTVSFEWILMEEIPVLGEDAIPASGYFAITNILPAVHNSDAGAGEWSQPRLSDGSWTHDKAQMPHGCPPADGLEAWPTGRLTWDIPIGWGDALHTLKGRIRPNPTQQVYEIQGDGTLSVSKFGHVIERQTNNCVRLDGQLLQLLE